MFNSLATLPARVNLLPLVPLLLIGAGYCLLKIFLGYGIVGAKLEFMLPLIPIWVVVIVVAVAGLYD
jgi:hypothetical protein